MEYTINENECARKNELPRLIQHSILAHVSRDPILRTFLEPDFEQLKPKYLEGHKKTLFEFKVETDLFNFKRDLMSETREKLIKLYQESLELRSIALLDVCLKCTDNPQCPQYQDYLSVKV